MLDLKNSALSRRAMIVAVSACLLCIYHLIPNIYHIPVPIYARPFSVHYKYVEVFAVVAFLSVVIALIARPKATAKSSLHTIMTQEKMGQD